MRRPAATILLLACLLVLLPVQSANALDPLRTVQWALDAINLDKKPAGATGGGVTVAVLDSGVDLSHPDLAGRVVAGPDFIDGGTVTGDPHGHGTHLAGLIAATAGNGQGGDGIAPAAKIYAVRVLDADNAGTSWTLTKGIDAAIAAGVDVINVSLNWPQPQGSGTAGGQVDAALRRAADAGIAVIVAAGNDALGSCEEPAQPDFTLCVGALDDDLRLAAFSSHGQGLGVVAPGTRLVSTSPGGAYRPLTGTSQSAAVVSGVAALLAGQGLRGKAIVDRIQSSARDLGSKGYDPVFGFGLVDAERAATGAADGSLLPLVRVSAKGTKAATVKRKGLKVICDAARAGTCSVKVSAGGRTLAKGKSKTNGGAPIVITAKPTASGRKALGGGKRIKATVTAGVKGAPGARAKVTLGR